MRKYDIENDGQRLLVGIPLGKLQTLVDSEPDDPDEPNPEPEPDPEPEPTPDPEPEPIPTPPNPEPDPEPDPTPSPGALAVRYRVPSALVMVSGEVFHSKGGRLWYRVTDAQLEAAAVSNVDDLRRYISNITKYKRNKIALDLAPSSKYRALAREALQDFGLLEVYA